MFAAMLAVLSLAGALHAAAETDVYRDIQKPHGHARGMAAKRAAFAACGYPGSTPVPDRSFPRFNTCMHAHGWVIDHIIPDPPSAHAHARSYDSNPPVVDNSANDDSVERQRQQTQDTVNQQNQNNIQQANQDQFDQQQQIINNNRLSD